MKQTRKQTPLSDFINSRLTALEMRQSEFCRNFNFDQGALSKFMSGQLVVMNLETAIKLALGCDTSVEYVLGLTQQTELLHLWQQGKARA